MNQNHVAIWEAIVETGRLSPEQLLRAGRMADQYSGLWRRILDEGSLLAHFGESPERLLELGRRAGSGDVWQRIVQTGRLKRAQLLRVVEASPETWYDAFRQESLFEGLGQDSLLALGRKADRDAGWEAIFQTGKLFDSSQSAPEIQRVAERANHPLIWKKAAQTGRFCPAEVRVLARRGIVASPKTRRDSAQNGTMMHALLYSGYFFKKNQTADQLLRLGDSCRYWAVWDSLVQLAPFPQPLLLTLAEKTGIWPRLLKMGVLFDERTPVDERLRLGYRAGSETVWVALVGATAFSVPDLLALGRRAGSLWVRAAILKKHAARLSPDQVLVICQLARNETVWSAAFSSKKLAQTAGGNLDISAFSTRSLLQTGRAVDQMGYWLELAKSGRFSAAELRQIGELANQSASRKRSTRRYANGGRAIEAL